MSCFGNEANLLMAILRMINEGPPGVIVKLKKTSFILQLHIECEKMEEITRNLPFTNALNSMYQIECDWRCE